MFFNVVLADVDVVPISPGNMPPTSANSEAATENNAMRVTDKSHSFIFDEIYRCSFIEYDPNQIINMLEEDDGESKDMMCYFAVQLLI